MMLEGDFAVDITIRDEGIVLQYRYAVVAQLAEQLIRNEQVAGSTPVNGSTKNASFLAFLVPYAFSYPSILRP